MYVCCFESLENITPEVGAFLIFSEKMFPPPSPLLIKTIIKLLENGYH